jgi:predicted alpha/beta hydrolase
VSAVDADTFEVATKDGHRLVGDVLAPAAPRAVAVLAHAMMVNRRTMDHRGEGLASALAAREIAVMNADLRGHGDSGPTADRGGVFTYDDFVLRDVPALVSAARARFPGLRVVVVGHSLGAHASAIASGVDPKTAPNGIVALAGNLWSPRLDPSLTRRALKRSIFSAWLFAAEKKGYFDAPRFRMGNTAEPLAYIRQFVAMYDGKLASVDGAVDFEQALGRTTTPILSIASEGDRLLANPVCVARFFALATAAPVDHRVVSHFDFGGRAPTHMGMVTDLRSRPVWHEAATWILELAN